MSFPRYPKYKDSEVEWLGEVPEDWSVMRLKRACDVFPSNVDKKAYDDEIAVALCNYTDVYYNEKITPGMNFMQATATRDQIAKFTLKAGDTIITKDSETADDIAVAAYVAQDMPGVVCGYHLSMVRPKAGTCGAFVARLFHCGYASAMFEVLANGLTRVGLGQYELDNIELPFAPIDEQTAIAAFLDRETAKIDALVAEQRRLIELLKEKRQAVISHAVTKGLNPDAAMKPSGIEWLGEVPEHWSVAAVRFRYTVQLGKMLDTEKITGEHLRPYLRVFDVQWREINVDDLPQMDFDPTVRERFRLATGDLLINEGGSYPGRSAIWQGQLEECYFQKALHRLRPRDPVTDTTRFFYYIMAWATTHGVFTAGGNESTIEHLPAEKFRKYRFAFPPMREQLAISEFLDHALGGFDTLTTEAHRAISLLQERRTALISAAVTGKIDVRGLSNGAGCA